MPPVSERLRSLEHAAVKSRHSMKHLKGRALNVLDQPLSAPHNAPDGGHNAASSMSVRRSALFRMRLIESVSFSREHPQ